MPDPVRRTRLPARDHDHPGGPPPPPLPAARTPGPPPGDAAARAARPGRADGLDRLDREILAVLTGDGRATYLEIGRRVRLSANAVADRVRRLRDRGVIRGYRAELDQAAVGRALVALTDVRLRDGTEGRDFEAGLAGLPAVEWAAHTTGEYDYQLRVVCADTAELEAVVETLKRDHGARELRSRIVLREVALDPARALTGPPRAATPARGW